MKIARRMLVATIILAITGAAMAFKLRSKTNSISWICITTISGSTCIPEHPAPCPQGEPIFYNSDVFVDAGTDKTQAKLACSLINCTVSGRLCLEP